MKNISRLHFAHLPTSIEELPRLSDVLGGPRIFVKRDDQTGLAFGGNKTRKLEFLLAEAEANNARTLVSVGAIQSNHCRQTAAAAARFGLDCILVLVGDLPDRYSGNLLLDHLFGAQLVWTTRSQRQQALESTFMKALNQSRRPYLVPYGGSSPTGACAYAFAIQELIEQASGFDWIVFASSSGGTQAGMVVGAKLFGLSAKILGISVDEPQEILQPCIASLVAAISEYLDAQLSFSPSEILVNADYIGEGYGILGQAEKDAIRQFARQEGVLLDPVYTGRAAAGLIDLIKKNFFHDNETVLFWHTGGTPALFADRYRELADL